MRNATTRKASTKKRQPEMKAEYHFSQGVRGKYVEQYNQGTNLVLIDPELTDAFPDAKSVNDALRALVAIAARRDSRKRV